MTKDEALKIALEVLEEGVQGTRPLGVATLEAITTIKEALAQPEQEPVAWAHHSTFENLNAFDRSRYKATLAKKQTDACCIPLYTTTPQRTWVGLTDKELNLIGAQWHYNLLDKDDKAELFAFARAIEAALRSKNT